MIDLYLPNMCLAKVGLSESKVWGVMTNSFTVLGP